MNIATSPTELMTDSEIVWYRAGRTAALCGYSREEYLSRLASKGHSPTRSQRLAFEQGYNNAAGE